MIKLDVQPYCQACPYFSAEVVEYETYDFEMSERHVRHKVVGDTSIRCKNEEKCERLVNYLKESPLVAIQHDEDRSYKEKAK